MAKGNKALDARFSGVGLFRNTSACRATAIWIATEVMKEMNRLKTMPYLQKVIVKKKCQKEERKFLSQQPASEIPGRKNV